jgi:FAD/FMN-containing dehydrogenase
MSLQVLRRGDDGYEQVRCATPGNNRVPGRYPDVIVKAATEADVVEAVKMAAREELTVAVRSGGHSFAVDSLRDGGMMLDVGGLDEVSVDRQAMTATAGPGRRGNELCLQLDEAGLFFPSGHCIGVALGGYLLQGGYGWNSRALGLACESVTGVDVVTADGETVHADRDHNSDLYWAARGAGPGFPGIVTRFHLRLHPKAGEFGMTLTVFPMEVFDEVYTWAREVCPEVDRRVEMQLLLGADYQVLGVDGTAIALSSAVFAESAEAGREAASIEASCPVLDRALLTLGYNSMSLAQAYELVMLSNPADGRRAVDNMWTSAPAEALLPGLRRVAETMPPPPSHLLWLNWGPAAERPDMAYSVEDHVYLALYGGWTEASDDHLYEGWATSIARELEPLASGIQLADENLGRRPARFMTDANMARLDQVRARWDPDGRFHSWMGRL